MKRTYKIIIEKINGKTREVIVVMKGVKINKLPDRWAEGALMDNKVKPKKRGKNHD